MQMEIICLRRLKEERLRTLDLKKKMEIIKKDDARRQN